MSDLIDEHCAHLRAEFRSERTIHARTRLLWRLHDWCEYGLAYAAQTEIAGFLSAVAECCAKDRCASKATIATYAMHFRGFFRWADRTGRLDGDPTLGLAIVKKPDFRPRPCTPEQAATALTAPGQWGLIFALAYYEGMRCCEIAEVLREDITPTTIWLGVTKGGDPASVPTHPAVWELVRDLPEGPLVHPPKLPQASAHWVSYNATRVLRRLGVHGVSIHQLRHRLATDLLERGADLRVVQEILRHSSVAMTQAYTQVTDKRKRQALVSLPILGAPAGA